MATDSPKARAVPRARTPENASPLDERYAALVDELEANVEQLFDGLAVQVSAEQRVEILARWQADLRPPLVKQLDALVGPARPAIAEACQAFTKTIYGVNAPKDFNVCQGSTVAVVSRLGRPESPGRIITHYPGCEKHARKAVSNLGASGNVNRRHRVFYSVVQLADARREIRQQELADEELRSSRPWWRRWR
jgi:hypothetical protein